MHGPDSRGIRITKVSRQSAFNKIGLKEGDIVHDVNGKPVGTAGGFIRFLKTASKEQTMIRIGWMRKNGVMDPIYIELQ